MHLLLLLHLFNLTPIPLFASFKHLPSLSLFPPSFQLDQFLASPLSHARIWSELRCLPQPPPAPSARLSSIEALCRVKARSADACYICHPDAVCAHAVLRQVRAAAIICVTGLTLAHAAAAGGCRRNSMLGTTSEFHIGCRLSTLLSQHVTCIV